MKSPLKPLATSNTTRRRFLASLAGSTLVVGALPLIGFPTRILAAENPTDSPATEGGMLAGVAKVEITPDGKEIRDLSNRVIAPRESLFGRVLVLKADGLTVALVSLDLIVFSSKRVIEEAKRKFGVDHVLLFSTHTHAAPAPEGLIIKPPVGDWTREPRDPGEVIDWSSLSSDPWYSATEEKLIAAIGQASENLFPAHVTGGEGPFASAYMAHNRRMVNPNGRVTMMWDNPTRLPTEPLDPTVGFLKVEDEAGKTRAFVIHYACHPVATMGKGVVSRDFPGAAVDFVEAELGPDCMGMFLQGASGDIDPYDMRLKGQHFWNVMKQSGHSLALGVLRVAESAASSSERKPASLAVEESVLSIPNRDGSGPTEVGIATVLINNAIALVAIPGEPFIQHQLNLRARSPVAHAMMAGLSFTGKGSPFVIYLPTEQAAAEGGYGATECTFLDPAAGTLLVDEALAAMERLHSPSR